MIVDRKFAFLAINPCTGNICTEKNGIVFAAKDRALPAALTAYREACIAIGCNKEHIDSIELLLQRVHRYQEKIESRLPDTIGECEIARCIKGEIK